MGSLQREIEQRRAKEHFENDSDFDGKADEPEEELPLLTIVYHAPEPALDDRARATYNQMMYSGE